MYKLKPLQEKGPEAIVIKVTKTEKICYQFICNEGEWVFAFTIEYLHDVLEDRKDIVSVELRMAFNIYTWDWSDTEDAERNYPFAQFVEDSVASDISDEMTPNKIELIKDIVDIVTKACKKRRIKGLY